MPQSPATNNILLPGHGTYHLGDLCYIIINTKETRIWQPYCIIYNKLWWGAQQTPPPAATYTADLLTPVLCRHVANATDSELWPVMTNNLTFDLPTRLPELTQNLIRSSHGHSTPFPKNSCKSVQPFSRNVADKETNKEIARLQYPIPLPWRGRGNNRRTRSIPLSE